MAKAVAERAIELEPIDRLEEKVKLLVGVIERLRTDQARAADENLRMKAELDAARARAAQVEGAGTELEALRRERDQISGRVADMLHQIESLSL